MLDKLANMIPRKKPTVLQTFKGMANSQTYSKYVYLTIHFVHQSNMSLEAVDILLSLFY